jgi:hypothetical protein
MIGEFLPIDKERLLFKDICLLEHTDTIPYIKCNEPIYKKYVVYQHKSQHDTVNNCSEQETNDCLLNMYFIYK